VNQRQLAFQQRKVYCHHSSTYGEPTDKHSRQLNDIGLLPVGTWFLPLPKQDEDFMGHDVRMVWCSAKGRTHVWHGAKCVPRLIQFLQIESVRLNSPVLVVSARESRATLTALRAVLLFPVENALRSPRNQSPSKGRDHAKSPSHC
jgi:hypothetical protein